MVTGKPAQTAGKLPGEENGDESKAIFFFLIKSSVAATVLQR